MAHEIFKKHLNQPAKKIALTQLFIYFCLGFFLKIMGGYYGHFWRTEDYAVMKGYLRAAHVHGLTLGFMLLFYSFLIEFSGLGEKGKKVAVTLAISGMVLMPVSLVLSAFKLKVLILGLFSAVMIISSVGILAWAHLIKDSPR